MIALEVGEVYKNLTGKFLLITHSYLMKYDIMQSDCHNTHTATAATIIGSFCKVGKLNDSNNMWSLSYDLHRYPKYFFNNTPVTDEFAEAIIQVHKHLNNEDNMRLETKILELERRINKLESKEILPAFQYRNGCNDAIEIEPSRISDTAISITIRSAHQQDTRDIEIPLSKIQIIKEALNQIERWAEARNAKN